MRLIFLMSLTFLILGCTHTEIHKRYALDVWEVATENSIPFRIRSGVDYTNTGVTVYGDPYSLEALVSYEEGDKTVALSGLSLVGDDGSTFNLKEVKKDIPSFNGRSPIVISINIGGLFHQPYRLVGEIVFENQSVKRKYPLDLYFKNEYSEKKVNRLWENLMSI